MNYYIGQALGLAATLCTIILPFFKKKWQILILNICVNLFVALNFVLIGQVGSAAFLCTVAIFQSIDSMVHDVKGTPITLFEKVLFLVLYVGFGFFGMFTAPGFVWVIGHAFSDLYAEAMRIKGSNKLTSGKYRSSTPPFMNGSFFERTTLFTVKMRFGSPPIWSICICDIKIARVFVTSIPRT